MEIHHLRQIADLLENRTDAVVNAWRQEVANATRKPLDEVALTDHMADLIKEMAETLRSGIGERVEEIKRRTATFLTSSAVTRNA